MKYTKILWILSLFICMSFIYYLYISPLIFTKTKIIVPDIVGLSEEDAFNTLKGLNLEVTTHYVDGVTNHVVSTKPKAGIPVYEKSQIEIYVETPALLKYISFVGLIYEENIDRIEEFCAHHHISYAIEYERDLNALEGQILAQSKKTSEYIYEGDILVFTIAVVDDYFEMPDLAGKSIYEAIDILNQAELKYTLIYLFAPIEEDLIISQGILPKTKIKKGNPYPLELYVSKGWPYEPSYLNLDEWIMVLNELEYEYQVIYVQSIETSGEILGVEYKDKYYIYVSTRGTLCKKEESSI